MQNVPVVQDLIGAGFTNHGCNQGGILIETESGGHVEFVNADRAHATTAAMPARFFSVEELYNTNRNPAELGIVHPLVYENEDSLVNQIGYGPGPLMNSDQHPMVWCRNFDGGRSFTTHARPQLAVHDRDVVRGDDPQRDPVDRGQEYANCVTFNEVKDLLAAAAADGNVTAAGNTALSARARQRRRRPSRRRRRGRGDVRAAVRRAGQARGQRRLPTVGPRCCELQSKGVELVNWMSGNETAPPAATFSPTRPGTVGGSVPATLSLTMGAPATFGAFTPGVAKDYTASTTATVISTAGDATLSVADPSTTNTGKLVNGTFALPQTLQANGGGAFAPVGGSASPTTLKTWSAPTSNEAVTIAFKQSIGANDALRTGTYSKTLTFTLSTTTP